MNPEDIQQQFEDIQTQFDDLTQSQQDLSDNIDSSLTDVQTTLDDHSTSLDELNNTAGQLTFPLSQDTTDLIRTVIDARILSGTTQITVGNNVKINDARILATSVIVAGSSDTGNYTQLASFIVSAGQAEIYASGSLSLPINVSYIITL